MTKEDGDKLVAFVGWLNSDANTQIVRWVDIRCVMRVVNGDLAHLYDGLLAGRKLVGVIGTTSLVNEVSHYKFVPPKTCTLYGVEIEMFDEKPSIGTIGYTIDFGRRVIDQNPLFYISCHKFVDDGKYNVNETFIKNKNDAGAVACAMTKQLLAGK